MTSSPITTTRGRTGSSARKKAIHQALAVPYPPVSPTFSQDGFLLFWECHNALRIATDDPREHPQEPGEHGYRPQRQTDNDSRGPDGQVRLNARHKHHDARSAPDNSIGKKQVVPSNREDGIYVHQVGVCLDILLCFLKSWDLQCSLPLQDLNDKNNKFMPIMLFPLSGF